QKVSVSSCRLTDLVEEAVSLAVPFAPSNLSISAHLEGDDFIRIDRNRVLRMVFNLVRNAATAIADSEGRIRLDIDANDHVLNIHISDTGPGIPEHVLDRLFPTMMEVRKYSGRVGLGLPTTAQAAAALGGQLILRQTSKNGTHFQLQLPYQHVRRVS
ncbi:MAG: ATP-binding protein, partial [Pseudomonadota bacterium]